MREILFRGKRLDNGEWVTGYYVRLHDPFKKKESHRIYIGYAEAEPDGNEYLFYPDYFDVDPTTVGQFTGLNDKNGKKVFEGDIIEFGSRNLVVWWDQEKFQWRAKAVLDIPTSPYEYFRDKEWDDIDFGWIYAELPSIGKITTTIISNIHDNPEERSEE